MGWFSRRDKEHGHESDSEIIAHYRAGGDNYFVGVLYRRYGHLALGLCIKYLRNKTEAEDAVMQIFGKLLTDLQKHRVDHFKSWLYVYTKNFCLMELRKRQTSLKRELELKEETPLLMDFGVDAHLKEREEQILMLEQAIETLGEAQRTCIRLFYLEDLSYAEVSGRSGYSVNEVKSHIQNGKRNLKLKLEARNEGARE
jgi:RNA polymerase sigma factor (sigma-70 family)